MNQTLSGKLMEKLRRDADTLARPVERHRTLDRLLEACNDIASGKARGIVKQGLPEAEVNFRRSYTRIKPPRIEEYVLARRSMDVKAGSAPSAWTGPMAATIRKDGALLEYVRVRESEQAGVAPEKVTPTIDQTLDRIEDIALNPNCVSCSLARVKRNMIFCA